MYESAYLLSNTEWESPALNMVRAWAKGIIIFRYILKKYNIYVYIIAYTINEMAHVRVSFVIKLVKILVNTNKISYQIFSL